MHYFYEFETGGAWYEGPHFTWRYTTREISTYFSSPTVGGSGHYSPEVISHDAMRGDTDEIVQKLIVSLPADSPIVAMLNTGLPTRAIKFNLYALSPVTGITYKAFSGTVKSFEIAGETTAKLTIQNMLTVLMRSIPKQMYQRTCQYALYEDQCNAIGLTSRTLWRLTPVGTTWDGQIEGISTDGVSITSSGFLLKPSGWLNNGYIDFFNDQGIILTTRTILGHADNGIDLISPVSFPTWDVSPIHFRAYAGCDRSATMCKEKFNNYRNYGGMPTIPVKDPFSSPII